MTDVTKDAAQVSRERVRRRLLRLAKALEDVALEESVPDETSLALQSNAESVRDAAFDVKVGRST